MGAGLTPTKTRWRFVYNCGHLAEAGNATTRGTGSRVVARQLKRPPSSVYKALELAN